MPGRRRPSRCSGASAAKRRRLVLPPIDRQQSHDGFAGRLFSGPSQLTSRGRESDCRSPLQTPASRDSVRLPTRAKHREASPDDDWLFAITARPSFDRGVARNRISESRTSTTLQRNVASSPLRSTGPKNAAMYFRTVSGTGRRTVEILVEVGDVRRPRCFHPAGQVTFRAPPRNGASAAGASADRARDEAKPGRQQSNACVSSLNSEAPFSRPGGHRETDPAFSGGIYRVRGHGERPVFPPLAGSRWQPFLRGAVSSVDDPRFQPPETRAEIVRKSDFRERYNC